MAKSKWVYEFGDGKAEGRADMRNLLGGKGAGLAEMSNLGLPVPSGFTITTEVCTFFYKNDKKYPPDIKPQVEAALKTLEKRIGASFGDAQNPLLVSVRSGARASMPGMMDTVLNLGLNDATVEGLAKKSGDPRFAYDSYRRFIQMYGQVVLGVDHQLFEDAIENVKLDANKTLDTELSAAQWQEVIEAYKTLVQRELKKPFPQAPQEQLWGAIGAVFGSWLNQRAITYRRLHGIPSDWGTAVNVQAMVFGNMGEDCATGVAFTRNPSTGAKEVYGEFLANAQGEDVVAGIRTPQPVESMGQIMPAAYEQLLGTMRRLEEHYRDMQDVEFTVEDDALYMLQTRSAKRTAAAAIRAAVEMVEEGVISREEAVLRIDPSQLDQLLHPRIDPEVARDAIAKGLNASPGAASGGIVFDADTAVEKAKGGP
ncbi:MAG: PEP/pyruvate-binding domain-containing protein, partial [Stellaceae bacterium]